MNTVRSNTVKAGDIIAFTPSTKTRKVTVKVAQVMDLPGQTTIWAFNVKQGNAHGKAYVLPLDVEMVGGV